jgi:hypothetical protein
MNFPLPTVAALGDNYLVDLGRLEQVAAVSPEAAYHIAMTSVFGEMPEGAPDHPMVYQIDEYGELIAVFD